MLLHMVVMWQDTGHGINPWLGLPLATLLSLAPYVVHSLWFESDSINHDRDYVDTIKVNPKAFIPPDTITLTGEDKHAIRTAAGISKPIDSGSSDFPKDVF